LLCNDHRPCGAQLIQLAALFHQVRLDGYDAMLETNKPILLFEFDGFLQTFICTRREQVPADIFDHGKYGDTSHSNAQ
jgi:hypothetical protein